MNAQNLLAATYQYKNQMSLLQHSIDKSNKRLSTGKQINTAADSPSQMLRISRLEAEVRGSQMAQGNIQDGMTYLDIKDSALSHAQEIGQDLRDLSVSYQNDTLTDSEKEGIAYQATELLKELDYVFKNTTFNKKNVFEAKDLTIQTGSKSSDTYTIRYSPMTSEAYPTNGTINSDDKNRVEDYKNSITPETITHEPEDTSNILRDEQSIEFSNENTNTTSTQESIQANSTTDQKRLGIDVGGGLIGLVDGLLGTNIGGPKNKEESEGTPSFNNPTESNDETGGANNESENKNDEDGILVPNTPDVPNENVSGDSSQVSKILDTSFIDEFILEPLASKRVETGVQKNILEHRLNFQKEQHELNADTLSRIEGVDVAKELMEKAKNEILLETNIALIHDITDQTRSRTLQLLYGT